MIDRAAHAVAPDDLPLAVSVVVPVYGSEATLAELTRRVFEALAAADLTGELIFVDDGSRDGSWAEIQKLAHDSAGRVVAIRLMRNFGQHNALMCGFRHARGALVVTLDDDLQNPPEEIGRLVAELTSAELDVVYGTPERKHHAGWRNAGSTLVNLFYRRVFRLPVTVTSFRVVRREVLAAILSYEFNFTFVDGLLAWNTDRIGEIPVAHRPRSVGRSGYSLSKLTLLALNLFTNFSLLPLQAVSLLGLATAMLGIAAGLYYLVQYTLGLVTVPGYASTIVAILTLGGVQLLSLGMMGEYLGRIHLNVNRKPQYAIRTVLQPGSEDASPAGRTTLSDDADGSVAGDGPIPRARVQRVGLRQSSPL